jgi:hypothetical protein
MERFSLVHRDEAIALESPSFDLPVYQVEHLSCLWLLRALSDSVVPIDTASRDRTHDNFALATLV